MATIDHGRRHTFFFLAAIGVVILFMNLSLLSGTDIQSKIRKIPLRIPLTGHNEQIADDDKFEEPIDIDDEHPIREYMKKADDAWQAYEDGVSSTFRETVDKYRRKYGRHPPPGFRDWYRFARDRRVHNVDDFDQIMDDMRPFWGIEPGIIRSHAAYLSSQKDNSDLSTFHVRDKRIWKITGGLNWRTDAFQKMIESCIKYLPDMDIPMNRLDQPRTVVPWDDMQALLKKELETRSMPPETYADWTLNMTNFYDPHDSNPNMTDPKWFGAAGTQYMEIARKACPPESPARDVNFSVAHIETLYRDPRGGFVTNFNLSSDLCTVGPAIQDKHGFLFASSSLSVSHSLLPVFGECKVNVNSDILFPANMYYNDDPRYLYDDKNDFDWDDKHDILTWRGVTSGGTNSIDNWEGFHRSRLVAEMNETMVADKTFRIMSQDVDKIGVYKNFKAFNSTSFVKEHTDVGFTGYDSCVPNCEFFKDIWATKPGIAPTEQYQSKYLIDVDGASFSGRWRAFLYSKSLGIKSTIFREWHDSRLVPWRHFVPLDNQFDELYSILTYFIGLGKATDVQQVDEPYVQRHDYEGRKIGRQGREWAEKVLRKEDIEIYMFRLLIEYARIIDDSRDRIGYSGDGSELDKYDSKLDKVDSKHSWSGSMAANGAHG